MQTIGLVGGMSWHSTVEYYRTINELVAEHRGGHASAKVALQSLDFEEIRQCQVDGDWDRAARLIAEAAQRCEQGGADVVLICTNLMHRVADHVEASLGVPLLHIADALAERATGQRLAADRRPRRPLGDGGGLLRRPAREPRPRRRGPGRRGPHRGRPGDLRRAHPRDRDRRVARDVRRDPRPAHATQGAEAVVLGCTEIELLVSQADAPLPVIPSMRTHAEAAVAAALREPRRRSSGPRPARRARRAPWARRWSPSGRCPRRRAR